MRRQNSRIWTLTIALLANVQVLTPAYAQITEQADASNLDEIIVTASKRPERLVDASYAISAITVDEINAKGATDLRDLQYSIPGMNILEANPGSRKVQMRGIGPGDGTGAPVVGVYVDEVGISIDQQQRDGAFPLADLARVEVLRGPQGTLYGQGAVAGTIRYITQDPSLTEITGYAEANVYNQEAGSTGYRFNGAIGTPLVEDKVGIRVAGGYEHNSGWIDYPLLNKEDVNEYRRVYVRPKLVAMLSDAIKFSLMYQYYKQETDTDNASELTRDNVRNINVLLPGNDKSHLINAILNIDLGSATLTSATGYQHRDMLFNGYFGVVLQYDNTYKQFSQEVRLTSTDDGPLGYTFGGYYRDFDSHLERTLFINGAPSTASRYSGDDPSDSKSYAFFGTVNYAMNDKLSFDVGARYFSDSKKLNGFSGTRPIAFDDVFDSFTPKFTLTYKWAGDASTYLSASKGFRSGGFNASGSSFDPESLWNYEFGTKAVMLNGRLFLDATAYYLDYTNAQIQNVVTINGLATAETIDGGKASGPGVELTAIAKPGAGLELSVTGGYNEVKSDGGSPFFPKGERFAFAPAFTGSASLSQKFPLGDALKAFWRVDYQHSSTYIQIARRVTNATTGAVGISSNFRSDKQDYVNVRVGLGGSDDVWTVTADATNLFNADPVVGFTGFPYNPAGAGVKARPRSYGLTLRWNFGQ